MIEAQGEDGALGEAAQGGLSVSISPTALRLLKTLVRIGELKD